MRRSIAEAPRFTGNQLDLLPSTLGQEEAARQPDPI